jgi:hypothetical protein
MGSKRKSVKEKVMEVAEQIVGEQLKQMSSFLKSDDGAEGFHLSKSRLNKEVKELEGLKEQLLSRRGSW